jgi:hypothetical protein
MADGVMGAAPQRGLDLPTVDEAIVRGRYPDARLEFSATGMVRVSKGTVAIPGTLSGWCRTREAAWKVAVERVRKSVA